jgi:Two component regulator propeller
MFAGHAFFNRPSSDFLMAWALRLSWAIACAVYSYPAVSEPVSIWAVFTPENSDLPHTDILALTRDKDGELWIGTHGGGLARLDNDGRWQIYTTGSTKGGMPDNLVLALAPDADGALWVGNSLFAIRSSRQSLAPAAPSPYSLLLIRYSPRTCGLAATMARIFSAKCHFALAEP